MERRLSRSEVTTLAEILLDTDDDLEIGISQLGYDPATIVEPPLDSQCGVRQCRECGVWFQGRRHGCTRGMSEK